MYRATTPTHVFWFNDIDPQTTYTSILITYAQNDKILLEKTEQDLLFGHEIVKGEIYYRASVKLTQEETSLFSSDLNNSIVIQIRAISNDGIVSASNKIKIPCLDVLDDKELEPDDQSGPSPDPGYDTYKGKHVVLPSFETMVLETQGKFMASNVTVLPIQVYKTTNLSGGITVFIGGIFNGE